MEPEVKSALVSAIQMIEFLSWEAVDKALDKMDLNEEAWNDELDILKKAVDWVDNDDEEDEEEDDEDEDEDGSRLPSSSI